jgi:hypothetical protein
MGLWGAESDRKLAEFKARQAQDELEDIRHQATMKRIDEENEMSRMIAKYNKVVADYKKLADQALEVVAERDCAIKVVKERLYGNGLEREEFNEMLDNAVEKVRSERQRSEKAQ